MIDQEQWTLAFNAFRATEKALSVSVSIPSGEADRIIFERLIGYRESSDKKEIIDAIDKILLRYFVTKEEHRAALTKETPLRE